MIPDNLKFPVALIRAAFPNRVLNVSYEVREAAFYNYTYAEVVFETAPLVYNCSADHLIMYPQAVQVAISEMKALGF